MMATLDQIGDILLFHSDSDAGDIIEKAGMIAMTAGFETMAYLCRFGGNMEDDGSPASDRKQWWGNEGEPQERKYRGRTEAAITGTPLTSASLRAIQEAAKADLEDAFVSGGYADSVETIVSIIGPKRVSFKDRIFLKNGLVYQNTFEVSA